MIGKPRKHAGSIAALLHRLSGLALAMFLPLHFLALATALRGAHALDSVLSLAESAILQFSIGALVTALAMHMVLGLRILAIEFLGLRERTTVTVSTCIALALGAGLTFLMNAH